MALPPTDTSDGTFMSAPYHLIRAPVVIAEQFVLYCMDRFNRNDFEDEVKDFGNVFEHRTAFIVRYCMAMVVYFEVTWVRGKRWVFPIIPAGDGEDDVKMRCDSSCLTQGVAEMLKRRYSGEMFEAVALFLGTYAVLKGRNYALPVRWRCET